MAQREGVSICTQCNFQYWFNEKRHPALVFGHVALPAYIIPLLLCTGIFCGNARRRRPRNRRQWAQNQTGVQFEDGDHRQTLTYMVAGYHAVVTFGALIQNGRPYKDVLTQCALAEAASLLLMGSYLNQMVFLPCACAALGWIILAFNAGTPAVTAIAVVLSLSCAFQVPRRTGLGQQKSAILLLRAALEYEPAFQSLLAAGGISHVHPLAYSLLTLLAFDVRSMRENVRAYSMVDILGKTVFVLACVASFLVPIAAGATVTGFSVSCIGWRWVIFGNSARPPTLNRANFSFGLLAYAPAFLAVFGSRGVGEKPDTWRKMTSLAWHAVRISLCATGWACSVMVGSWGFLTLLRTLEESGTSAFKF